MNFSVTRRFTINMGQGTYESLVVDCRTSASHIDVGYTDEEFAKLSAEERSEVHEQIRTFALMFIENQQNQELEAAKEVTLYEESFILDYQSPPIDHQPEEKKKRRAPRRK